MLYPYCMRKALHFLSILNDSDIDWLIAAGTRREVAAGVNLIEQGRPVDCVYLVIDGAFSVRSAGREANRLFSGEFAGEISFIDSAPPAATVHAMEHGFVLAIPRRRLNARIAEDAAFGSRFYHALCMFLAERLRKSLESHSGGATPDLSEDLSIEDMDGIGIAGARFDWIQQRLRSA
ncbi:MAG: putative transcriptional regulator, Crp/Fnr family [Candidatus Solibacter sp.]|jgi:CRP/FNR family cyclic AMP-dependent transcriptional regulator|nr:putative transcriptional regulator, Crp/Fnr family [Candidatus Solibacter sp.]